MFCYFKGAVDHSLMEVSNLKSIVPSVSSSLEMSAVTPILPLDVTKAKEKDMLKLLIMCAFEVSERAFVACRLGKRKSQWKRGGDPNVGNHFDGDGHVDRLKQNGIEMDPTK